MQIFKYMLIIFDPAISCHEFVYINCPPKFFFPVGDHFKEKNLAIFRQFTFWISILVLRSVTEYRHGMPIRMATKIYVHISTNIYMLVYTF